MIAAQPTDQRERDAGIARGGLDEGLAGLAWDQASVALGRLDERQRHAVLHRSGRIAALELGEDGDVGLG